MHEHLEVDRRGLLACRLHLTSEGVLPGRGHRDALGQGGGEEEARVSEAIGTDRAEVPGAARSPQPAEVTRLMMTVMAAMWPAPTTWRRLVEEVGAS